jgi:hypothetical protein
MKKNCWEIIHCGREEGGYLAKDGGEVCPAASSRTHDGNNKGKNAGRYCWRVAGSMCGGEPKGYYSRIVSSCENCQFLAYVKRGEGAFFLY